MGWPRGGAKRGSWGMGLGRARGAKRGSWGTGGRQTGLLGNRTGGGRGKGRFFSWAVFALPWEVLRLNLRVVVVHLRSVMGIGAVGRSEQRKCQVVSMLVSLSVFVCVCVCVSVF